MNSVKKKNPKQQITHHLLKNNWVYNVLTVQDRVYSNLAFPCTI